MMRSLKSLPTPLISNLFHLEITKNEKVYFNFKGVISSISQNHTPQKFTLDDEKRMRKVYKLIYRERYEALKHRLVFPDYYPEILELIVEDNRLYVLTYRRENNNSQCFIFDLEGKLLKKLFIPIAYDLSIWDYPFDIQKGKLYQLIENENEEWELHLVKILDTL